MEEHSLTRRLHIPILVLLGAAMAAPVFAGMLYVPIAVNRYADGVTNRTEVWISNPSDTDLGGFFSTYLPALSDGTVRTEEPPAYFVAPGESVRFTDLVPADGFGMLEIEASPGLVVSARLVTEVDGLNEIPEPVELPVLGSGNILPAGHRAWLQGLERLDDYRYSNFGIVNLGQATMNCSLDVRHASGLLIVQNINIPMPPLSMVQYNDAFSLLPLPYVPTGARMSITCDQPFWTFFSLYDDRTGAKQLIEPSMTPEDSTLQKPTGDGGGGSGGGGEPPDSTATVFTLPGQFLNCSPNNTNWRFNMPFGGSRQFKKVILDFDVRTAGWDSHNSNGYHCVFWLNNGNSWSDMMGYLNALGTRNLMRLEVNAGTDIRQNKGPGMQTNSTYHVNYVFDTNAKQVSYKVTTGGGTRVQASYSNNLNKINTSSMFIEFGTQLAPEGPEATTYNWKFSNFQAQFVP